MCWNHLCLFPLFACVCLKLILIIVCFVRSGAVGLLETTESICRRKRWRKGSETCVGLYLPVFGLLGHVVRLKTTVWTSLRTCVHTYQRNTAGGFFSVHAARLIHTCYARSPGCDYQ